jgi:hypothetical protein
VSALAAGEYQGADAVADLLAAFASARYPVSVSSTKLEASHLISAGGVYLYSFTVSSTNVAAQFIQFHDTNAIPGNGAIPVLVFTVAASGDKTVAFGLPGRMFDRGIVIANSTTAATLTAGAADCFFDVQVMPIIS